MITRLMNGAGVKDRPRSGPVGEERWLMSAPGRSYALDHIVVVLFENRSLDNVLGHLYGPGWQEPRRVIGKDLSNPIPACADQLGLSVTRAACR